MGAAAVVLTNKPSLAASAKYELLHSVRAHVGQDDKAYRAMGIFTSYADGEAKIGYNQDVPMAASKAIMAAVTMVSAT
jgi:3-ketoacyl-CoA synthase